MGLLDSLFGQSSGGSSVAGSLLNSVIGLISSPNNGGLAGLVQKFESSGLAAQAQSWVGTGANLPITGTHVNQALGIDQVRAIAQKIGLDPNQVSSELAQLIPHVVDRLTPNGSMVHGQDLANGISNLLRNLTSGQQQQQQ